jgi:hypothetical protein
VTVTGPTAARPAGGRTIDFVVVPDCAQLSELVQRVRVGRLRTNTGNVATLDDAVAAFRRTERIKGKTIIRVVALDRDRKRLEDEDRYSNRGAA